MARRNLPPRTAQLDFASGSLAIAFVNTAAAQPDNSQLGVASYAELLVWGQQVAVLSAADAEHLGQIAADRPADADAVFALAERVRGALARVLFATWKREAVQAPDLKILNQALTEALPQLCLVPGGTVPSGESKGEDAASGLTVAWAGDADALDRVLWPPLHSAAELLASPDGCRVRRCAGRDCELFFFDRSESRRRRWCDMKTCGARAKALNFYYRKGKRERDAVMDNWKPNRHRRKRKSPR